MFFCQRGVGDLCALWPILQGPGRGCRRATGTSLSLWDLSAFEFSEPELSPSLSLLTHWVLTVQTFLWTQDVKQKDLNSLLSSPA